jgi:ABC-type branched-subunit amino acid transport system substrate-binding protein
VVSAITALVLIGSGIAACGAIGGSGGSSQDTITYGEIYPFTGSKVELSGWGVAGAAAGQYEVNHHGGVLGKQLQAVTADDAADAVDALPALRKLLLSQPKFILGPFSPTIEAVIGDFAPNHVVDLMMGGTAQLDNMNNPYVFRTFASDSTEATAMAIHAINKGYRTASLIFDNSANSQGFVAPLTAAFRKLGGTVLSNQSIVPAQSSYRSELVKAFAGHPQVVFASFDTQTAATLWSDAGQLGYLSTPWLGDDLMATADYSKAFGGQAATSLFAALPAAPTGPAYSHFLADYEAVNHSKSPLPATFNIYDSVVIAALAMTEAKSSDPKVWVNHVVDVSSPPGTTCTDYASCVSLLKAGKDINYEGAGGSNDFNAHHNVFSGFSIYGFASGASGAQVAFVTAADIAKLAG